MNLKETLNLPKTTFPHKLDKATENRIRRAACQTQLPTGKGSVFTLHDGPPFANGDIHLGHAINKVLKDILVRMAHSGGCDAVLRPGWDCHGLPIENDVRAAFDGDPNDVAAFRTACGDYAMGWVEKQREQFKQLAVCAQWDHPYMTMDHQYEHDTLKVFADLVGKGLVYRKEKPVHWSIENQTALAVGELEYKEVTDKSIYVGFNQFQQVREKTQFLVWTTTPWTLPANACLAVNKDAEYVRIEWNGKWYILAAERAETLCPGHKVLERLRGTDMLGFLYIPPFDEGQPPYCESRKIYHADFVTTDTGTGIVHIAPSHGLEDYYLCSQHKIYPRTPVQKDGRYVQGTPRNSSLDLDNVGIFAANKTIIAYLEKNDQLHSVEPIHHEYPHDWRSKKPTIQLAMPQWFIALDTPYGEDKKSLRDRCIEACETIQFVPESGKSRFVSMLKTRQDWCISRQRSWGLPIPAFYDQHGEPMLTKDSVERVAWFFQKYGSNIWYSKEPYELVPDPFGRPMTKETDTFDVWFESGASFTQNAIAREFSYDWDMDYKYKPRTGYGADVYIEGSDQHRGWFQHSLLLGMAVHGKPPFKTVITHGFVVKPNGEKVSKSDPEYVRATEMLDKIGTDPIRLWIASNDFKKDICASPEMLTEFVDKYSKLRNSLRFLISNLGDFDPKTDSLPLRVNSLDMWMVYQVDSLLKNFSDSIDAFNFHTAVAHVFNFLNNDLSSVYANAMKDRLYCGGKASSERRRTQTTMAYVLWKLMFMLEPIIPLTIEEVREHFPHTQMPSINFVGHWDAWSILFTVRPEALAQLDALKKSVGLTKATDAEIVYIVGSEDIRDLLQEYGADLEDIVGCGCHSIRIDPTIKKTTVQIIDRRADYQACARSWKRRSDVTTTPYGPLSHRDFCVVRDGIV